MSGIGARQRRTANRRLLRKPPVIKGTQVQPSRYVEVLGSPWGFVFSCLMVAFVVGLAIVLN